MKLYKFLIPLLLGCHPNEKYQVKTCVKSHQETYLDINPMTNIPEIKIRNMCDCYDLFEYNRTDTGTIKTRITYDCN